MPSIRVPALLALAIGTATHAQQPPTNGMRPSDPARLALVGAKVLIAPGNTIEKATILVRDGVIETVGAEVVVPAGYRVFDVHGKTIVAAFIEPALVVDSSTHAATASASLGAHWNPQITPEVSAVALAIPDATLDALRAQGFAVARVLPEDGIFRGTSDMRLLARSSERVNPRELGGQIVQAMGPRTVDFSQFLGPQTPGAPRGERESRYPASLMGSYALMRQTFQDAAWRTVCLDAKSSDALPLEDMNALDALQPMLAGTHGIIVDASDELEFARLVRLVGDCSPRTPLSVLGSGLEFRAQSEIVALSLATKIPLILPIDFPQAPDLVSPVAADSVSLRDLMTWQYAPTNPKRFIEAGIDVALTTHRMQDRTVFRKRLADAITHGLSPDDALAALTTKPAAMLGIETRVGTLEQGKIANFIVASGEPFDPDTKFEGMFIAGTPVVALPDAPVLAAGSFAVTTLDETPRPLAKALSIAIDPKAGSIKASWEPDPLTEEAKKTEPTTSEPDAAAPTESEPRGVDDGQSASRRSAAAKRSSVVDGRASGIFDGRPFGFDGEIRASIAGAGDRATMLIESADGTRTSFTLTRIALDDAKDEKKDDAKKEEKKDEKKDEKKEENGSEKAEGRESLWRDQLPFPFGEFGRMEPPSSGTVVVKDATVWTLGTQGTLTNGDMLVRDGKIVEVAAEIPLPEGAILIDGRGMHVTPGLIDCHSHTGISGGVNEGTQSSTAEVWIGDVIDPTDIGWYRQLAGGLVAVNQLHGSANPIGGRNSVVKIRWGEGADAFRFADAPSGIKFALGENVVRSKSRYPSSRMGVAAFLDDSFAAAREYRARQKLHSSIKSEVDARPMPPRPDLELETLAEILEGTRLVHCHSYRQDEILMLLRTAEKFGFRVATLQHVLEGYKVAGEIAAHGAGASSFSDWWAYKIEVMDAIPWNGAIMHRAGVVVSFNSDSDELARRMNMEAAKAMRYGGLSPEDALKLVTLNPARQLRIDARTGSLEVGKDADFALWNGNPLSAFSRCEETWIDGVRRYSRSEETAMHAKIIAARGALLAKATSATDMQRENGADATTRNESAGRGRGRGGRPPTLMERMLDDREDAIWLRIARGQDPFPRRPGDCGCDESSPAIVPTTIDTN